MLLGRSNVISMKEITASQLVTVNLKFSGLARPLKGLAFADIASNALFAFTRKVSMADVSKKAANIIGISQVDERLIADGLEILRKAGKARKSSGEWELTSEERETIQAERETAEKTLEGILSRQFPKSIETTKLREWFLRASSDFFGYNGAEWVKSIARFGNARFAKPQTITNLLKKSIKDAHLEEYENVLVDGYHAFLSSENSLDLQYLMNLGFAMFTAQLVAVDVGADPIGVDEISGTTFILDTNTLYAMQLDAHRLAKSITALGRALKDIDTELVVLNVTKQEYNRVFMNRQGEVKALFREFPEEVVLEADDYFIESGVAKGCANGQDFDRFFESIRVPPKELSSGLPITDLDDSITETIVQKAESDLALKTELQKHCMHLRGKWDLWRPKTKTALNHDAALIHVVEMQQKEKPKTRILSLDRSLRACAAERAGPHTAPSVFMLDGLIQILAVNSGGPGRSAEDFAPLLTNIILNRCTPAERTYSLLDLRWLHNIQKRVTNFQPAEIKKIATIVSQHRLAGAKSDDHDLTLAVNRAFLEVDKKYDHELELERDKTRTAEEGVRNARVELESARRDLGQMKYKECVREARRSMWKSLYWRIPVAFLCGTVIFIIAVLAFPNTRADILPWAASIISFGWIMSGLTRTPVRAYQETLKTCQYHNRPHQNLPSSS